MSNLPPFLVPFEEQIAASKVSFIKIIPKEASKTDFWQSKIGGLPYLPKGFPYPTGKIAKELLFFAQINCSELPPNKYFPKTGMLQFFINDDALFGMGVPGNVDSVKSRVLYHPTIEYETTKIQTDFSFLRTFRKTPHNLKKSFPLSFSLEEEIVPIGDINILKYVDKESLEQIEEHDMDDLVRYTNSNSSSGHKMGGYAFFANLDPRKPSSEDLLLLQIDSDPKIECYWGDMGIAHFFIDIDSLINRDYSNAYFQWDDYSVVDPNPY